MVGRPVGSCGRIAGDVGLSADRSSVIWGERMTLGLPWRCAVVILIALIVAVAALSYHPSKRRTMPALWSSSGWGRAGIQELRRQCSIRRGEGYEEGRVLRLATLTYTPYLG